MWLQAFAVVSFARYRVSLCGENKLMNYTEKTRMRGRIHCLHAFPSRTQLYELCSSFTPVVRNMARTCASAAATASTAIEPGTMRLTTTTDSADAATKIMTAAEPVKNSNPLKQEKILSWYMWKGELNKDPGIVRRCVCAGAHFLFYSPAYSRLFFSCADTIGCIELRRDP